MPDEARPATHPPSPQNSDGKRGPGAPRTQGDASEFCPVCSRRLAARACKLICACGFYMSCSDYY